MRRGLPDSRVGRSVSRVDAPLAAGSSPCGTRPAPLWSGGWPVPRVPCISRRRCPTIHRRHRAACCRRCPIASPRIRPTSWRPASSPSPSCIRSSRRASWRWRTTSSTAPTSTPMPRAGHGSPRSCPRFSTSSARWRWSSACGRWCCSPRPRGPAGGTLTKHYVNDTVNYTEPLFVVVIMALASTRPIIVLAERAMGKVAALGRSTPAAWWFATLTIGPLLGSLHHRAGGDDHLRAAALAAVLRPQSEPAPQVRHAGPAVRERLDRRHAHPFRSAAHPDGRAAVGMGPVVRDDPLRLAHAAGGVRGRAPLLRDLPRRTAGAGDASGGARPRGARRRCRRRRTRPAAPRARVDHRRALPRSWRGRW